MDKILNYSRPNCNDIAILIFIMVIGSCSTASSMFHPKLITSVLTDSLLIDRDGNKYPIKKFYDNSLWMTVNLKLKIPDSYCYENKNENCEQYGRLYTWESAKNGCAVLGDGWRLPTNDEW